MTVYLVGFSNSYLGNVVLGVNSDQDAGKVRAEAHWNNQHNASLRWLTYEDSPAISAQPVGKTDSQMGEPVFNTFYFVQPFEVDK